MTPRALLIHYWAVQTTDAGFWALLSLESLMFVVMIAFGFALFTRIDKLAARFDALAARVDAQTVRLAGRIDARIDGSSRPA